MATIAASRASLGDKLTPRLARDAETILPRLYAEGRRQAALGLRQHGENAAADRLPTECPYGFDEICRQDWYPPPAASSGSGTRPASRRNSG